jgi:hypothetical protein
MLFLMPILTAIHVLLAVIMYSLASIIFKKLLRKDRLSTLSHAAASDAGYTEMTQSEKYLLLVRSAIIVRSAVYEGIGMFGLIICLIGAANGILQSHTVYWVNTFSTIVALWMILKTYPSRDMILEICKKADFFTA